MALFGTVVAWMICFLFIAFWVLARMAEGLASSSVTPTRGPTIFLILGLVGIFILVAP